MTFWIGFSGPIAAGKSTAAKLLQVSFEQKGYTSRVFSFANGVREVATIAGAGGDKKQRWGLVYALFKSMGYAQSSCERAADLSVYFGDMYPNEAGVKNRRLLQLIGTEVGREVIGDRVWIDALYKRAEPSLDFGIVDDVRFDNEAQSVDLHVHISVGANLDLYHERLKHLSDTYAFSDHKSEQSLSVHPMMYLPIGFTYERDIENLCFQCIEMCGARA